MSPVSTSSSRVVASSMGLGIASSKPHKQVVVLDGDGSNTRAFEDALAADLSLLENRFQFSRSLRS